MQSHLKQLFRFIRHHWQHTFVWKKLAHQLELPRKEQQTLLHVIENKVENLVDLQPLQNHLQDHLTELQTQLKSESKPKSKQFQTRMAMTAITSVMLTVVLLYRSWYQKTQQLEHQIQAIQAHLFDLDLVMKAVFSLIENKSAELNQHTEQIQKHLDQLSQLTHSLEQDFDLTLPNEVQEIIHIGHQALLLLQDLTQVKPLQQSQTEIDEKIKNTQQRLETQEKQYIEQKNQLDGTNESQWMKREQEISLKIKKYNRELKDQFKNIIVALQKKITGQREYVQWLSGLKSTQQSEISARKTYLDLIRYELSRAKSSLNILEADHETNETNEEKLVQQKNMLRQQFYIISGVIETYTNIMLSTAEVPISQLVADQNILVDKDPRYVENMLQQNQQKANDITRKWQKHQEEVKVFENVFSHNVQEVNGNELNETRERVFYCFSNSAVENAIPYMIPLLHDMNQLLQETRRINDFKQAKNEWELITTEYQTLVQEKKMIQLMMDQKQQGPRNVWQTLCNSFHDEVIRLESQLIGLKKQYSWIRVMKQYWKRFNFKLSKVKPL